MRVLLVVTVPLLTLLPLAGLLVGLDSFAHSSTVDATPAATVMLAAGAPAQPAATPAVLVSPTTAHAPGTTAVAIVDGVAILAGDLATALAIDRALSHLGGIQATDHAIVLEQLVNGELVWQAMARQGASTAVDVAAARAALLASLHKDAAALDVALTAEDVTRQAFDRHLARLVAIDRFARQAAGHLGSSEADYLRTLQRKAQISYGTLLAWPDTPPAAATATPERAAENPTATPAAPAAATDAVPVGAAPGLVAPGFMLPSGDGQVTVTLAALAGRPLLLSFWTTWCPYCLRQTPVLVEAHARQAASGIQFLGVAVRENAAQVDPYITQHQIPYPIVLDLDGAVAERYGVAGYPTTFFIDAGGRIVAKHIGALTPATLDDYLTQVRIPGHE